MLHEPTARHRNLIENRDLAGINWKNLYRPFCYLLDNIHSLHISGNPINRQTRLYEFSKCEEVHLTKCNHKWMIILCVCCVHDVLFI